MKSHYCPEEKAVVQYEGECNWCGEKEHEMKSAIPEGTKCRSFGCNKKADTVIIDTKGRRQYCCAAHVGKRPIKEKTK